jgi:hypothetical protein
MLSEDSLYHFIDSVATYIDAAKDRHFELWPILGIYTWPNPSPLPNNYAEEITALKTWIQLRTQWLDANIPGTCHLGLDEASTISHCSVVPNPFESQFELKFFAANPSKGSIYLEDLNGRVIHSSEIDIHFGDNSMMVQPTTTLPDGAYFVRIIAGSSTQVVKVLKH